VWLSNPVARSIWRIRVVRQNNDASIASDRSRAPPARPFRQCCCPAGASRESGPWFTIE